MSLVRRVVAENGRFLKGAVRHYDDRGKIHPALGTAHILRALKTPHRRANGPIYTAVVGEKAVDQKLFTQNSRHPRLFTANFVTSGYNGPTDMKLRQGTRHDILPG